ncbi:MAG: hypothetical protein AAFX00_02805 [Pseudomonadota bacterium]
MAKPVQLKTLYDCHRERSLFFHDKQLMLHVASWHKFARATSDMTVTVIGTPPEHVRRFVEKLGGRFEYRSERHPLQHRSVIYNKHLSAPAEGAQDRIYLSDNDTVYLSDTAALAAYESHTVGVSPPDNRRVSPELWAELRSDLDLPVLEFEWVPQKEAGTAYVEGRAPITERYAYFNGGAILFPAGREFWDIWEGYTYKLSRYFESRGMNDRRDAGSDQLSLTAAVADYGDWKYMPQSFNVRPFQFWLPGGVGDRVDHIHMVNTGRAYKALPEDSNQSFSALMDKYWEIFFLENVHPDYRVEVQRIRGVVADLIQDYGLE